MRGPGISIVTKIPLSLGSTSTARIPLNSESDFSAILRPYKMEVAEAPVLARASSEPWRAWLKSASPGTAYALAKAYLPVLKADPRLGADCRRTRYSGVTSKRLNVPRKEAERWLDGYVPKREVVWRIGLALRSRNTGPLAALIAAGHDGDAVALIGLALEANACAAGRNGEELQRAATAAITVLSGAIPEDDAGVFDQFWPRVLDDEIPNNPRFEAAVTLARRDRALLSLRLLEDWIYDFHPQRYPDDVISYNHYHEVLVNTVSGKLSGNGYTLPSAFWSTVNAEEMRAYNEDIRTDLAIEEAKYSRLTGCDPWDS